MSDLLNKASLVVIPSGYKEDTVYSVVPSDGSGDLSFTRASNGTRINSAGLVEVCPWNLLEQSNSFSTSPWFLVGTPTLTSNYAENPLTGANDAWRFQSASDSERVVQSLSGSFNAFSLYAKGTGTIRLRDSAGTYSTDVALTSSWQRVLVDIPAVFTNVQITSNGGCDATIYGAQLNIGSTAKPYFPTTDRLNVPRLTYQNGGGGCPSLLLEKQSTNEVTYSESFSQANWVKASAGTGSVPVVTTNYATSPDGTQNADLVVFDRGAGNTSSDFSWLYQTFVTASATYTMTCYVKAATSGDIGKNLSWRNFGTGGMWSVNLTNEWQRIVVQETAAGGVAEVGFYNRGTYSTGNSVSVLMWGFQAEQSSYETSYIPTTSSSATRVADACSKTGISSLIGQTEGVLFCDFEFVGYGSVAQWIAFLIGAAGDYIGFYTNSSNKIVMEVSSGGPVFLDVSITLNVGTRYKMAVAYKANDFAFYVNGSQISIDASGSVPSCSEFNFNYNTTAANIATNKYNQAALFKTRLTNSELASLTTI